MRICYVSYEYPPQFGGGIGTYVGTISKNLAFARHEIHVITFNSGNLPEYEVITNVKIHRISMNGSQMEIINQAKTDNLSTLLYWTHYSEKVYRKFQELVLRYDFDAVEFADYRGEGYHTILAKKIRGEFSNIPFVVRMHTPLFVLNEYNNVPFSADMAQLVQFEKLSILLADHVVSPCTVLAKITEQELELEGSLEVVPHPIDVDSFPKDVDYKESEEILYVGRLEHRKGVVDLIKAMIRFLPNHPNARLKLIGGDTSSGPGFTSMKEYLQSLLPADLKERVIFVDRVPREKVLEAYRSARFCVFPSLFENFPNVCLEAMASGTPVLVSHYSGMAEMVENGVSGVIFQSGNVNDLVEKLIEVYSMSFELRKNMAISARKRVETAYSTEVINHKQIEYFQKISNRNKVQINTEYIDGLVSIVIPCYNHGQYLKETLASIKTSTYQNIEIIIVNDGSTDSNTLEVLSHLEKEEDLKVIHQENAGLSAARNTGVLQSKGQYVLPLDADDLIDPSFLEKTVKVMQNETNVGFVYTYVKFFGAADGVWKTPEFDPNLLLVSNLCVATSLFRRIAFDQVGGYKTDMIYGFEDWDFWIYLVENGWKGKCIPEPLFMYRKHSESMLSNSQKHRAFLIEKLIEHHKETYKRSLEYVLVEKDRQFFEQHMSSYLNFKELSSITQSKAWKVVKLYRKIKDKTIHFLGGR